MASFWDWIDYHSNQKTKSQISADVHRAAMESHLKLSYPYLCTKRAISRRLLISKRLNRLN